MADKLYLLALLLNAIAIFQCAAIAVFAARSAGKVRAPDWSWTAVWFCLNSAFTVLAHLGLSDLFDSYISHSIRMILSPFLHILIAVNIYLIPRLAHQAIRHKAGKPVELLFLACAVFTIGYEFVKKTGIVFIFLAAAYIYLAGYSIYLYFSGRAKSPEERSVTLTGLIMLLVIPFVASDIFGNSRTGDILLPLGSTRMVFSPFIFTACSVAALRGIIQTVKLSGNSAPSGGPPRLVVQPYLSLLSLREREIFDMVIDGFRNKDIARGLTISESTVKKHVQNILKKTGSGSRLELIRKVESAPREADYPPADTKTAPELSQITPEAPLLRDSRQAILKTTNYSKELKSMKKLKKIVVLCGIVLAVGTAAALALHFSAKGRVDIDSADWHAGDLLNKPAEFENKDGFWILSEPEKEGYIESAILAHLELAIQTGADALLVARKNRIVCEWYSERYETPICAMSSAKSVSSLVCGIMRDKGLLSIDDRVSEYLPEWRGGFRDQVSIRHLLSMTSGLLMKGKDESVGYASEKNSFVLRLYPDVEPGTSWSYSNEGVQLLSPLMEAAAGEGLNDFAKRYLFGPLGMERSAFHVSGEEKTVWTYADMQTSPRDFARLGYLVMNGGVWNGEQIISQEYLREALTPLSAADFYGLLWWLHDTDDLKGYGTEGYLDTDMYVFPKEELIIVRMQTPRTQFSGEKESGDYQKLAWRVIPAFTNPDKSKNVDMVLREILKMREAGQEAASKSPGPANNMGNDDYEALETRELNEVSFAEDLKVAIEDSRNGKDREVISRLQPYLDQGIGDLKMRTEAQMTLITQYMRLWNTDRALKIFNDISIEGIMLLPEWYGSYYEQLETELR